MRLTWLAAARGYARRLVHPEPRPERDCEPSPSSSSTARRVVRDELYRASRASRE